MKLTNKKNLAARTLGVGKDRIVFNSERLNEIKEAITKQDIRDLLQNNAITIKQIRGRKTIEKRKNRRRKGSIKKIVRDSKRDYIILTRKLRSYISELRNKGKISEEMYSQLRKEIKAKSFKDKLHLKERISPIQK